MLLGGSGGGMSVPEAWIAGLAERFRATGRPRGLSLMSVVALGDWKTTGNEPPRPAGPRQARGVGGLQQLPRRRRDGGRRRDRGVHAAQGALSQLCRDMAAGRPGLLTRTGLHTFVDPRLGGGKQSARTTEDLVELVTLHGEEYLFYRAQPIDLAVIRGTTADERGNVTMEDEPYFGEQLSIAQAARNRGATVVCQVSRIAAAGTLPGKQVKVPGALVDYLVVVPDEWQTYVTRYDPAYAGAVRRPDAGLARLPLDIRKVIARRAALELFPGAIVNLGFGVSNGIAPVAAEEGIHRDVTLTVEQGIVGGVPAGGNDAGAGHNYDAMVDQPYQFDFYDGGGLDVAFLSFAEVDAEGNVNVSRFGRVVNGPGGFVNISQGARKVVFSGTLTADGLEIAAGRGRRRAPRPGGADPKWVPAVQQITFSGRYARARGQEVMYVTDRAVFRLGADGIEVVEVAPGVGPGARRPRAHRLSGAGAGAAASHGPAPVPGRADGHPRRVPRAAVTPPEEASRAMSEPELVRVTVEAGVAVLTLDNPPLNVVTLELTRRLRAALDRLAADPAARVLVVTGAGTRAFCAGSDVSEFPSVADDVVRKKLAPENEAYSRLDDFPKPTIAALNGLAYGGGLELAVCCDILIAGADVRLALPEVKLGVLPGSGGTCACRVGWGGARQGAHVHGRPDRRRDRPRLGAREPRRPARQALAAALELARTLAERPNRALQLIKEAADLAQDTTEDDAIRRTLGAVRGGLPDGGRPRGRARVLRQGAAPLAPPVAPRAPLTAPRRTPFSARRRPAPAAAAPT